MPLCAHYQIKAAQRLFSKCFCFGNQRGEKLLELVQLTAEGELLQVSTVGNASRVRWITTAEGKVIQSQMKVEGHCVQTCTSSLCNRLFAQ